MGNLRIRSVWCVKIPFIGGMNSISQAFSVTKTASRLEPCRLCHLFTALPSADNRAASEQGRSKLSPGPAKIQNNDYEVVKLNCKSKNTSTCFWLET